MAKFQTKILLDKSSMKVYSQNIGKILPKINIHGCIFPILLINFINIWAKTMKYKESLNINFSKTVYPIWLKTDLRIKFSMIFSLQQANLKLKLSNFILPLQPL